MNDGATIVISLNETQIADIKEHSELLQIVLVLMHAIMILKHT